MMNTVTLVNTIKIFEPEMEISINKVQKGNVKLTGISIGTGNIRTTLYMEHFEDMFEEKGYIAVANEMIKVAKEAMKSSFKAFDMDKLTSWEYARKNLKLCIAPKNTNEGYLVYPYLDLELYVRVKVNNEASYKVKTEMLEKWGISTNKLLHEAFHCTTSNYDVSFLGRVIYEMTGCPDCLEDETIIVSSKD